jgi:hypothetical protein
MRGMKDAMQRYRSTVDPTPITVDRSFRVQSSNSPVRNFSAPVLGLCDMFFQTLPRVNRENYLTVA